MRPSGSGAFEAIECGTPFFTHRIGVPSGFALAGSSNVVPTTMNLSSAVSAAIVATRLGLSMVFTVNRSGRAVRVPSSSTDISRRWSGPNACSTYNVRWETAYANALAVPLLLSTTLPVRFASSSTSLPSVLTAKLETELSPPLVANRNRRSFVRMTLFAPSKAFGALASPLTGLNGPEPAPPVRTRSTSVIVPS